MMTGWNRLHEELQQLSDTASLRTLREMVVCNDGWVMCEGRRMLNVASNDYLGMANVRNDELATADLPWGAGASRLVAGTHPIVARFEREFAAYKGTESALFFNSGYTANLSIISTLCGRDDAVFSDRLNHASIVDGALHSRASLVRYGHRDLNELESLLKKTPARQKKLIVSDALFSMDGTIAPLRELVELKDRYGAWLMVDEAHSGGVFGEQGQGLTHQLGLSERIELQMGTFSKSYGRFGAYLACSEEVRNYLVNKARAFIYTTALPPVLVAEIRQQWLRIRQASQQRTHVLELAKAFRNGLVELGCAVGESESQIVPWIVGTNERALLISNQLQARGILAVAIRPPTVPRGTARIRFSWSAVHSRQDVDWVLQEIEHLKGEADVDN